MTIAVVAEKPAVARDIAKVLGAHQRGAGYLHGNGYVVTWAVGHLVTLAQPHEINPNWQRWRRQDLPMLPDRWPLIVSDRTRDQFILLRKILGDSRIERVVCATDAGREGELIFRYIYEAAECRKPFSRLWISSLTPEAIRAGFAKLRDGHDFDPLADAARGRSQADWLVGMNLSRACTLAFGHGQGDVLSVGRVQTPTLALVVERELAIRAFVPEDYLEVVATFKPLAAVDGTTVAEVATYPGTWFRGDRPDAKARRLKADGTEAQQIIARALAGQAQITEKRAETRRLPPPLLYDLTELQRHANRLYGFSAEHTLNLAQQLYEQKKLITYPRTDSRHLSQDVAATLGKVVRAIQAPYADRLAPGSGQRPLSKRFVDDTKVTDHHAIIPTPVTARDLAADEQKLYDLICRRLLAAWHDDHIWSVTTVITTITTPGATVDIAPIQDRYHSSGAVIEQIGWKILDLGGGKPPSDKASAKSRDGAATADEGETALPAGLAEGQRQQVLDAQALSKQTRPPPHFTEATLLTAMETAGRLLEDKELSAAMKETGLGTPATRAEIIETLLRRGYLQRQGKTLLATDKGIRLISLVHPDVKSPLMTGQWEAYLKRIQRGEADLAGFMAGIRDYVRTAVANTFAVGVTAAAPPTPPPLDAAAAGPGRVAKVDTVAKVDAVEVVDTVDTADRGDRLPQLLHHAFRLPAFRPYQETACRAVVAGHDVLLVMPTGAGKSLCFQLPGLVRGGTTLVVSPLIALMEDQVAKLQALGLHAERIHSGRDRLDSRRVCQDYLDGRLDFLFIAPERLSVTGFPELLARCKPTLIAVDEAHCISHWGHDFRPDYRMLGLHLPRLRPAPIIALTATATPLVQNDILQQLGMTDADRFIHGFRRTNIAVEVTELKPSERLEAVRRVLADPACRPAIVYTATRKETEALSAVLAADFPTAAYHAGMTAADRDYVQQRFNRGELEVIVATIAFGMGVDKPDIRTVLHTALPASLEGYYQEIGRAGRDGRPARAILLYSYIDRRIHEFFHNRDYPAVSLLERLYSALNEDRQPKELLREWLDIKPDVFDSALEKLWIHGGARVDADETVVRGAADWQPSYLERREHKLAQLEQITRFARATDCRMRLLVQHFGDLADTGEPCGCCDVCAPQDCLAQGFRPPDAMETRTLLAMLDTLRQRDGLTINQLYQAAGGDLARSPFEQLLHGLVRAGLVRFSEHSFNQEGKVIPYWRVHLSTTGKQAGVTACQHVPLGETAAAAPQRLTSAAATVAPPVAQPVRGDRRVTTAIPSPLLLTAIKAWRRGEAHQQQVPAFRILHDRVLQAIAIAQPRDETALLAVAGMGPTLARRYGKRILEIIEEANEMGECN